jgi:hypothetical protein
VPIQSYICLHDDTTRSIQPKPSRGEAASQQILSPAFLLGGSLHYVILVPNAETRHSSRSLSLLFYSNLLHEGNTEPSAYANKK